MSICHGGVIWALAQQVQLGAEETCTQAYTHTCIPPVDQGGRECLFVGVHHFRQGQFSASASYYHGISFFKLVVTLSSPEVNIFNRGTFYLYIYIKKG